MPAGEPGSASDAVLQRMMHPKSVAIIGMSAKPNTAGHAVLRNWLLNEFTGDIHLIGRSAGEIEGMPIEVDLARLPEGIDVAVLTLPAAGVGEALAGCAARKVGAAVVFASGFAEVGEQERSEQERIGRLVRESGLSVVGPNCIGYTNFIDGFTVAFASVNKVPRVAPGTSDGIAILAQSGGLGNHLRLGLDSRGIAVTYTISTGNEMDLGLGDFVEYLLADNATRVIMIYAEHIRQPTAFMAAAQQARVAGKPVVLLHPGRSARAKEAAKSHTGALAGDHAVMRAKLERVGVVIVNTLDEMLDVSELLARYPRPKPGGLGIVTFSGAFCGIVHDFCEDLGVPVPPLSAQIEADLKPQVPSFIPPKNPLDLGTQPLWQPEIVEIGVAALLKEPAISAVAISIPAGAPANANGYLKHIIAAKQMSEKPLALAMLGDASPLPPDFIQTARQNKIVLSRSSDRTLRAMAHVIARGNHKPPTDEAAPQRFASVPKMGGGVQPEWRGKQVLAAAGIAIPRGGLAETLDQAIDIAERIGFPVVMKAQAAALAHKTEAGGVLLNIGDANGVRKAWQTLIDNIRRAQAGLPLDGMLVESMAPRGLELVIGARRDTHWGPIVLIGLGGILVEALQDVRLIAPEASEEDIIAELDKLKTAKLLHGFRNMPPADVRAAAQAARAIGRLMLTHPEIDEIDVNPLMVHPRGEGATALDALVVTH
ncbi:MAG TPA: acetate--CoA ligase family protein [Beijerinckiaceae bacterium]|nr:acetate--CoA ligase family protein [Beijerinckiaceae bacterium]